MTTSMTYCYFQNLWVELRSLEEMLDNIQCKDPDDISPFETKAALDCMDYFLTLVSKKEELQASRDCIDGLLKESKNAITGL